MENTVGGERKYDPVALGRMITNRMRTNIVLGLRYFVSRSSIPKANENEKKIGFHPVGSHPTFSIKSF